MTEIYERALKRPKKISRVMLWGGGRRRTKMISVDTRKTEKTCVWQCKKEKTGFGLRERERERGGREGVEVKAVEVADEREIFTKSHGTFWMTTWKQKLQKDGTKTKEDKN